MTAPADFLSPALRAELAALGRMGAASRERGPVTCAVCRATVQGIAIRRYCSNACRSRAARRRRTQEARRRQA